MQILTTIFWIDCFFFLFPNQSRLYFRYGELMRRGLAHPEPAVPQLVVHQLLRFVGDDELAAMVGHHDIFLPALNLLGGDLANAAEVS